MSKKEYSLRDIRGLLIEFLAACSVRKEMCLPVLLLIGESRQEMLDLMVFVRDNDPTEHEIIQMALELVPDTDE